MSISAASIGLCSPQSERSQTQSSWGTFLTEGAPSQCFLFFYEIGLILRTALIDFERNSVHGKMHFVDAAVGQSSQQHGLGRKIEQPRIICNCFKIG